MKEGPSEKKKGYGREDVSRKSSTAGVETQTHTYAVSTNNGCVISFGEGRVTGAVSGIAGRSSVSKCMLTGR